ncbi:flavodoxin family protein [Roseovarius rhodophyticola]|uniref:NAD(P)H-dependent oxidoreductase n=1 Tax=Roseovarius rhodophyticola TaxID=3080827 RepID=A0ABZ2TJK3_9RHOB|nr:NAD(P)H-dependent oxidoreductase [Roseovarius sp. W115]MDV2930151.1 NAD(P)H-dependent oxidoreductase [Roseovarius sp. W115]
MTDIVCLLGSPRKAGNSDLLAERFCAAAEVHGAQTQTHSLRDLRFQGYTEANGHMNEYGPDDDLGPVLADVEGADVLVLATPIYFCNISGLTKLALDRFFAFLVPDYLTAEIPSKLGRDKTLVFVQTQGESEDHYTDILEQYAPAFDKLGFTHRYLLRACNVRGFGDITRHTEALMEADLLARRIVLGNEA